MNARPELNAVHVNANPSAALEEASAAQLELFDEGEIVELSLKPSLWLIVFASGRFLALVAVATALVVLATRNSGAQIGVYAASLGVLLAALRLVVASLQWASRVYVLTNRRVMRLSGVLSVELAERPLKCIARADLRLNAVQRALGVGSITMQAVGEAGPALIWEHVARVGPIHEKLTRAIRRAQLGG